jgi:hypothetical protein
MNAIQIKSELLKKCLALTTQRIDNARQAMSAAQEAANNESKSSAGDKYETGRAMAQIERDKAAQQLSEALALKNSVEIIALNPPCGKALLGSLVKTNGPHFFIAISAGKVQVDDTDFFVVAPSSPIGRVLIGLQVGDPFTFNNQRLTIQEIL